MSLILLKEQPHKQNDQKRSGGKRAKDKQQQERLDNRNFCKSNSNTKE